MRGSDERISQFIKRACLGIKFSESEPILTNPYTR